MTLTSRGGRRDSVRALHQPQEQDQPHLEEQVEQNEQEEQARGQKELDPTGLWFNDSSVTRAITAAMQQYFLCPWRNYSEVDQPTKDHWFKLFKPSFKWRSELEHTVRECFDQKAGVRLKDLHYDVINKKGGVCPKWMSSSVHEQMMANAKQGDFLTRSEKAKKNRRGGDLASNVRPSHCQGSISASERAKRLAAKSGGVMPKAVDLYLDTHFKDVPGKGLVPVSDKANKIKELYDKNVSDCKESGIQKDLNQVYFETVGGRKKGKVLGLGTSADLYYDKSSRRTCTSSITCTPSIVSQLSQRMEESDRARGEWEQHCLEMERQRLEMERERIEWLKAREEERQREREYVEELKRTVESYGQMLRQCSDSFPFTQPRDPRDSPDPSGSSGACAT